MYTQETKLEDIFKKNGEPYTFEKGKRLGEFLIENGYHSLAKMLCKK